LEIPTSESRTETHISDNASLKGVGAIAQNFGSITINNGPTQDGRQPIAHNVSLKYLADRDEQERLIRKHLTVHRPSRRPILFFVHGDPSQCLDAFIYRLGSETLRKQLRSINNTDQLEWKMVYWPGGSSREASESNTIAAYKSSLIDELEIPVDSDAAAISARIAFYRRPLVLSSVHTEVGSEDSASVIRSVLDMWASLPDLRTELSLIIFVALIYTKEPQGFLARLWQRPKMTTMAQVLSQFENYKTSHLKVVVLPELGNVTLAEVEHWVRNILRPNDIEDALTRARQVFGNNQSSLPMSALQQHLDGLVPNDRARLRLQ
jgi:hypothetical protein